MTVRAIQQGILLLWLMLAGLWLAAALRAKRTATRQTTGSRLRQVTFSFLGYLLLLDPALDLGWLGTQLTPATLPLAEAGLVVFLAGLAFCLWARLVIGSNWSGRVTIKEGHELVRRGPYAIVRHPIYTGLLTMILGTAMTIGHARCYLAVLVAGYGWWMKLRTEERFMLQQFGEEYASYRRSVRALIPFVL